MRARLLLIPVFVLVLLAGCGSDKSSNSSSVTTEGSTQTTAGDVMGPTVTIKGIAFNPTSLTAKVGDTITVKNEDGFDHSFTADDGSFDTGKFSSGAKTVTVNKAGTVAFHCVVHSS